MSYKKLLPKAYKQSGDDDGDEIPDSVVNQNPLMRQIAKIAGVSIDKENYSLYSTLLNKYARKFESFSDLVAASSRFGANPQRTIDKLYAISGSIVETLEDLEEDIENNKLTKILSSIMTDWADTYRVAKLNLIHIDGFRNKRNDIKISAVQTTLQVLKKSLAQLTISLDAYSGYFQYAQQYDERNRNANIVKVDYKKLIEQLENEADALSLALYMPYQTSEHGPSFRKEMMQGATLRICDRLVEIIRPYIDPGSPQSIKDSSKIFNLLHDISVSSLAMWKILGRLDNNKKFIEVVKRDLITPLSNVIYLLATQK